MENVRTIEYTIPPEFAGKYLVDFLSSQGFSTELIKHLKKTTSLDMFEILYAGEPITINIIETEKSDIVPNDKLKLDILYEDEDMIVVNKSSDMPTHPSQGNYENTLGNAIMAHMKDYDNFVYRPITRLDRDTTGVCLIAKNMYSASNFSYQMTKGLLRRTYLGVCQGNVYNSLSYTSPFSKYKEVVDSFPKIAILGLLIDIPIKRDDDSTIKRVAAPDGERAITKVYVMKYFEKLNLTLCKFLLYTGRTHQIRVHMEHLGYPIIGDFLYNPDYSYINRQALHSNELLVQHPITKKLLRFTSKIPDDFKMIIE